MTGAMSAIPAARGRIHQAKAPPTTCGSPSGRVTSAAIGIVTASPLIPE